MTIRDVVEKALLQALSGESLEDLEQRLKGRISEAARDAWYPPVPTWMEEAAKEKRLDDDHDDVAPLFNRLLSVFTDKVESVHLRSGVEERIEYFRRLQNGLHFPGETAKLIEEEGVLGPSQVYMLPKAEYTGALRIREGTTLLGDQFTIKGSLDMMGGGSAAERVSIKAPLLLHGNSGESRLHGARFEAPFIARNTTLHTELCRYAFCSMDNVLLDARNVSYDGRLDLQDVTGAFLQSSLSAQEEWKYDGLPNVWLRNASLLFSECSIHGRSVQLEEADAYLVHGNVTETSCAGTGSLRYDESSVGVRQYKLARPLQVSELEQLRRQYPEHL